ncbi:MAG: DUF2017 family protein [Actinomycetia bacterium]|nr:DUF2017 family protein [Actinomycetes bacterium]MCP4224292.1 DUF2017 family protein [Actinomycetes bacterium]MCP5032736.1 DUF2017 family protein [Actinomycetes bacterium]
MFRATTDGFAVELVPEVREWVIDLADQLESLLESDDSDLRRLFPTAYPDDPERDAGYQILARQGLIDGRREAITMMRDTVDLKVWTEDQLTAWMGVINDLRLVLGTKLDVGEDDDDIDFEIPEATGHLVYHQLGYLLGEAVEALTTTLPPAKDDDI